MPVFSFLAFGVASLFALAQGDIFCDTEYACRSGSYTCDERNNCLVSCEGEYSCQDSTFLCPYGCEVRCYGTAACADSTFTYYTGGPEQHCQGENSCTDATVNVYNDTRLYLTCDGSNACEDGRITCFNKESRFSVECSGPDSCDLLSCTCDGDNCEVSGPIDCADTVDADTPQMSDETAAGFLPALSKLKRLHNLRKKKIDLMGLFQKQD